MNPIDLLPPEFTTSPQSLDASKTTPGQESNIDTLFQFNEIKDESVPSEFDIFSPNK